MFPGVFFKSQNIFLHNHSTIIFLRMNRNFNEVYHSTIIKFRKFTIEKIMHDLYSNFSSCPHNVFHSILFPNEIHCCIYHHVLLSFLILDNHSFLCLHDVSVLKRTSHSSICVCLMFPWVQIWGGRSHGTEAVFFWGPAIRGHVMSLGPHTGDVDFYCFSICPFECNKSSVERYFKTT